MWKKSVGFPGDSVDKESTCNTGETGFNSWVRKIPWRRKWQPTPVFLPGKSHGQRSLEGYSLWGRKRVRHDLVTKLPHERIWRHSKIFYLRNQIFGLIFKKEWIQNWINIQKSNFYNFYITQSYKRNSDSCLNMHDLEVIMLIEICQAQFATRQTLYDSIDMRYLWRVKFIEAESRMVVARGWGEGEMERCLMGIVFWFYKTKSSGD